MEIPEFYLNHFKNHFTRAEFLMLKILLVIIQTQKNIQLGKLASDLPLPILHESRRKKIQRFLDLPQLTLETIWFPIIKYWLISYCEPTRILYLAIDRTQWATTNFLMIALIWDKRAIPLYFVMLPKKGSSNLEEQKAALERVLPLIREYKTVVLGDREFCSVRLAKWLKEQDLYFCLRLKKNEYVQYKSLVWTQLQNLGLAPGMSIFLKGVKVTKTQGFAGANLAAKWKKSYRGKTAEEGWFILTNLKDLKSAISAYKQRFDIEEMFRDCKTGGYNLEASKVSPERLQSLMLLITLVYSMTTLSGTKFKRMGVQKYIARPKEKNRVYRRYSTFQIGVRGENWAKFMNCCHKEIEEYVSLNRNHRSNYQLGQRAGSLILKEL